jgi:hypothetical protein
MLSINFSLTLGKKVIPTIVAIPNTPRMINGKGIAMEIPSLVTSIPFH